MHEVAFTLGPLKVHWYGILVVAGFIAGLWTASRRGLRDGLSPEGIADLGLWLMIGAIVGSRGWHVVVYWQEAYADQPWWEVFAIYHGGLVFHGGLVGASLATVFYTRARGLPLWKVADALAPSIPLGHAFGRIGCLMNGCCYGLPTQLPWAIHFPRPHLTNGVGVHPAQLYEAVLNLALFGALAWRYRRKTFDGQIFAIYLVTYAMVRFVVEAFRGDYAVRYFGGWLTPGQLTSVVVLAVGAWLYWRLRSAPAKREHA